MHIFTILGNLVLTLYLLNLFFFFRRDHTAQWRWAASYILHTILYVAGLRVGTYYLIVKIYFQECFMICIIYLSCSFRQHFVCSCSSVSSLYLTVCDLMNTRLLCPSLSPWVWLNSNPIESVMPSYHLILCCPLLHLPSTFPRIRVFSSESALCIRWLKYWTFSISPSKEYSRLISFRMYSFGLLVVQGKLNSLFQHHNLKASILQCSAFFMFQLLNPYITTGKNIALTIQIVLSKVLSLLFNI